MGKLSDTSLEKKLALKRIRARVRLELAVVADRILNEVEEEFETEFNRRVAAGEPYQLDSYDGWAVEAVNKALPSGH